MKQNVTAKRSQIMGFSSCNSNYVNKKNYVSQILF